jgi:hypothetical protein
MVLPLVAAALVAPSAALADHDDDDDEGSARVFLLTGSATLARDPENPANEVVRLQFNTPDLSGSAGVTRFFNRSRTQLRNLDNQLEVRHRFETPDTCGVGTPRMQLAIDLNGDNVSDGNAFGYLGTFPNFVGCQPETWLYEDFTGGDGISGLGPHPSAGDLPAEQNGGLNEEREWDVTQLTGAGELVVAPLNPFQLTYSEFEMLAHNQFPNHRVCRVTYIEDASGGPVVDGHADLISIGDETLEGWEDVAGRLTGPVSTCRFAGPGGDDDDNDDDDDDDDHDDD